MIKVFVGVAAEVAEWVSRKSLDLVVDMKAGWKVLGSYSAPLGGQLLGGHTNAQAFEADGITKASAQKHHKM